MRHLRIAKQVTNRDTASLEFYLREIGKEALISVDEEIILARRIKTGDRKAYERLVRSNLRFVVSVAKQYHNKGLTLSDLINEGNLGLLKAAERYDETRGFKFITYAVWWIRQSILQAISEQSRIVRLPLNKVGDISKINKAFTKLEQDYQREPMPEEIAEIVKLQTKIVREALESVNFHISTDAPLYENDNEGTTLYDTLINGESTSPDHFLIDSSFRFEIERAFKTLSDHEAEVLSYYFGLIGEHPLTTKEIAVLLQLTPERVRQIKEKALENLKNVNISKHLRSFLD